tara:strand:+ start:1198 stop:1578 length:381 start_codon:yes stop_codon:yes gene_type:complete
VGQADHVRCDAPGGGTRAVESYRCEAQECDGGFEFIPSLDVWLDQDTHTAILDPAHPPRTLAATLARIEVALVGTPWWTAWDPQVDGAATCAAALLREVVVRLAPTNPDAAAAINAIDLWFRTERD